MSPKQKLLNARELTSLAKQVGFVLSRQKGSHMIFYHATGTRLTIPDHGSKPLHPKIVKRILKDIDDATTP
ncbi:MAG: hypothetical protein A2836_01030 [Candidatus Taylorbacteria bacterium RIFCSPHIGHO2_01_FULL_45_63]|uniref:Addiction module toxin, HicA family n=1 Tax=Candidatus Taylorbacteria bacterium RIFCSPHIGHO2_02_FULL_45_35 TaxID=1802311 RepID=A0A1G2MPQ5_9BACT|nr:MAG: hypothetical protein A2836_01030 [Candidatus Taylorbacteria bacterium RIFCSPHIGHO2_01_FULL_45_63]OHA25880.1 MAG: hypothetical protein A3D56_01800 [Candidatus Taylorbacteria bacterium RIFCSPHIGHO2_02_FULL_45_35]